MEGMTVIADVRIHENKDENLVSAFGLPCAERLVVRAAVDLAATTVMTAGKVVVKGTGAVIDAPIPDRDKKKDRKKDKGKNRRPVSNDGLYPGSYPPASEEGGYYVPQGSRYSGLNLNQDKATKPQTLQIVR